ncbi:hypothetical protein ARMA_2168 [Ardenticatena maritima]|uniref:Uncharacterized protein n=1 Tax=Ardenticatena maritima TaxID=872965 RepID=A0A0M9UD84_9CHLR|nr:hypothetical protein ARMA_2168 [Ardenticatena maritima]
MEPCSSYRIFALFSMRIHKPHTYTPLSGCVAPERCSCDCHAFALLVSY